MQTTADNELHADMCPLITFECERRSLYNVVDDAFNLLKTTVNRRPTVLYLHNEMNEQVASNGKITGILREEWSRVQSMADSKIHSDTLKNCYINSDHRNNNVIVIVIFLPA